MKVLSFLEKNILQPKTLEPREVLRKKLAKWIENGVEMEFITGISKFLDLKKANESLKKMDVDSPVVHSKQNDKDFIDLVKKISPDVLIENVDSLDSEQTVCSKLENSDDIDTFGMLISDPKEILDMPDTPDKLKAVLPKEQKN